jgi:hypothetical protein
MRRDTIDKSILELLKSKEDTPLELATLDGKSLQITPLSSDSIKNALENVNQKFPNTLKNLAK